MSERTQRKRTLPLAVRTAALSLAIGALGYSGVQAQAPAPAAPPTPQAQAPIDLTGTWVSVVTEDWRWRMLTPDKGDYASVPMSAAALKLADNWDPAKGERGGHQGKGVGRGGVMRVPGRFRISWQDDDTLKIDTDAGQQT